MTENTSNNSWVMDPQSYNPDTDHLVDPECAGTVDVSSLGDVLRSCDPDALAYPTPEVQAVIVAALDWFVVQAPMLAAEHCAAATDFPVPTLAPPRITVERALRPTTLRSNVTPLRRAQQACVQPYVDATNALPKPQRRRVLGTGGGGQLGVNSRLLGELLDDFVFARDWCTNLGTKAGYWSYLWTSDCMRMCAVSSELARAQLADALKDSAEKRFTEAMDAQTT